jgi:hypothetical protein
MSDTRIVLTRVFDNFVFWLRPFDGVLSTRWSTCVSPQDTQFDLFYTSFLESSSIASTASFFSERNFSCNRASSCAPLRDLVVVSFL